MAKPHSGEGKEGGEGGGKGGGEGWGGRGQNKRGPHKRDPQPGLNPKQWYLLGLKHHQNPKSTKTRILTSCMHTLSWWVLSITTFCRGLKFT